MFNGMKLSRMLGINGKKKQITVAVKPRTENDIKETLRSITCYNYHIRMYTLTCKAQSTQVSNVSIFLYDFHFFFVFQHIPILFYMLHKMS